MMEGVLETVIQVTVIEIKRYQLKDILIKLEHI